MTEATSIVAQDLTVKKSGRRILDTLNFEITPGVITGLIGPSGSGKTTLLRTIVGVQKISLGQLHILGQPAGSKELRPRIGYVTQSPAVYDDLTVRQNLMYFGTLMKAAKEEVDDAIAAVRLEDKKSQLAATLSGGEKARVSLAIALLGSPDVLILDEPTVGLDPLLRQELWQLFARQAASGKTLLVSSHVMDEAEKCDQLLLMRGGKLLWHNSRVKLLEQTSTSSVGAAFLAMVTAKGEA